MLDHIISLKHSKGESVSPWVSEAVNTRKGLDLGALITSFALKVSVAPLWKSNEVVLSHLPFPGNRSGKRFILQEQSWLRCFHYLLLPA